MSTKIKGIDISRYNGSIDFKKVKDSGIEFVMIRCGTGYGQRPCKDVKFETYYKLAKAAGLKVGTYFYSYAPSVTQARTEAAWVLDWIKGKQFDYPIVFDMEERGVAKLGKAKVSAIAIAFCSVVEHAGYYVSIYSSKSWIESYYIPEVYEQFDLWVAQWASKCTYGGSYGMWQYTDSGKVPGIAGAVDMNYAYKDYASIIKNAGLNGFKKPAKVEPKPNKPVDVKPKPAPKPKVIKAGDKLVLKNIKLYANSTTSKARKKLLSGVYYVYDGKLFGNRYRITNNPKRVGKKPVGLYVTGYINKEDVR